MPDYIAVRISIGPGSRLDIEEIACVSTAPFKPLSKYDIEDVGYSKMVRRCPANVRVRLKEDCSSIQS